jgi:hypothetical protein
MDRGVIYSALAATVELFALPFLAAGCVAFASRDKARKSQIVVIIAASVIAAFCCAAFLEILKSRSATPAQIEAGENLSMTLNQKAPHVELGFEALLTAGSQAHLEIEDIEGAISTSNQLRSGTIPFSANDFQCSSKDIQAELPFHIAEGGAAHLHCRASTSLTNIQSNELTGGGDYKVTIKFESRKNPPLIASYCIVVPTDDATSVGKTSPWFRRFVDANC